MLKIKFSVPVQIKGVDGKRQNLKPGTYELDEEVVKHWFVQGLISSGLAILTDELKPVVKSKSPRVISAAVKPKPVPAEKPVQEQASTILENVVIEEIKPVEEKTAPVLKKRARRK